MSTSDMGKLTKITAAVLREWDACEPGYDRFNELFPDGSDLKTAADRLADDGHVDWSIWLFDHCREDERFKDQAVGGFRNTGDCNTGYGNTGNRNTGDCNTGDRNTGGCNTGDCNTGYGNTGDCNTGYGNTGYGNTGDRNTGGCNTGDWNTGYFNTITPHEILVFNRLVSRDMWNLAMKPNFIYRLELTWWVDESHMTDEEKVADPNFYMRGGQLRNRSYRDAWRKAWDETNDADRRLVLSLPNFDADVFLEISGIDVRTELGGVDA